MRSVGAASNVGHTLALKKSIASLGQNLASVRSHRQTRLQKGDTRVGTRPRQFEFAEMIEIYADVAEKSPLGDVIARDTKTIFKGVRVETAVVGRTA